MTIVAKAEGIKKVYQDKGVPVHAVRGIDLEIHQGDFAAIAGPSGSGKTTFLNMIGALDTPTEGTIYIDGEDTSTLTQKQIADIRLRKLGFVFQAYNLIPVLTCQENAEFVLLMQGISHQEREKKVDKVLE